MAAPTDHNDWPKSDALNLCLTHPTPQECVEIWTNISASWKDCLTIPAYIEQSKLLTTTSLAKDGGMTMWILVDKTHPPNQRSILCSCETIVKRAITSDADGNTEDNIIHGVASVFCPEKYRRRGYAARLLTELSQTLYTWQAEKGKCIGSILYSDIGRLYYAQLGWLPHLHNCSFVFRPSQLSTPISIRAIAEDDLPALCRRDEAMVRKAMSSAADVQRRLTIVPDLDNMMFHITKERFATKYLFGKTPSANGAIAGSPGQQVWAIWYHRYYGHPDSPFHDNDLYILRLVVEGDDGGLRNSSAKAGSYGDQMDSLKAVIQAALIEADVWRLDHVKLWDPTALVREMVAESGMEHELVERETNVASGLWYGKAGGITEAPMWLTSGYYPFV